MWQATAACMYTVIRLKVGNPNLSMTAASCGLPQYSAITFAARASTYSNSVLLL